MPEDTNLANDIAENSFDSELDAVFDLSEEEEELDVTFDDDGEEEGAAEDTNPENRPEAETAQENEQKPETQPAAEVFTLKYKGQENSYSREQLIELAQKGLDYDGVRADRDRLRDHHPALDIIDRYAQRNNMSREEYMEFAQKTADEAEVAPVVRQLMESGTPEAVAKELALRRLQEQRGGQIRQKQEQEAAAKQQEQQAKEEQRKADYKALIDHLNAQGLKADQVPQEVIERIAKGEKPLQAYLMHENAQLRLKASQLEQNQKNRERNMGRVNTDQPKAKESFDDAFDEVFGL